MIENPARMHLLSRITAFQERLIEHSIALIGVRSENPPGDTRLLAEKIAHILSEIDGIELDLVTAEEPIINLVARLKGKQPGRRLILNGHLDTYPVGDPMLWTIDPLAGIQKEGRLYGRGISDMKGGIAASMMALFLLAECREAWTGELVMTLAGDEETMGKLGTYHLLQTVPHAQGDAMICGDAGSPGILRFGEKGFIWLEVCAVGKSAHGAHVHLGENAIERLNTALATLFTLRAMTAPAPAGVNAAIMAAQPISERLSGRGETLVLTSVTVNIGMIEGGQAPNLVADAARAVLDIRIPVGLTVAEIEQQIETLLAPLPGIDFSINRRYEPNWTSPDHEIIKVTAANSREVLGVDPVVTMRVGASDARLYRGFGIPSVVCGLTPYNMGAADEYIMIADLIALGKIHTLSAFDYLTASV